MKDFKHIKISRLSELFKAARMIGCMALLSSVATASTVGEPIELIEGDVLTNFNMHGGWSTVATVEDVDGKKAFTVSSQEGTGGILINGTSKKKAEHIRTKQEFDDVEVNLEFMVPLGSNAGVYFMGRYEIQILDSYGVEVPGYGDLGGVYQRGKRKNVGFEGSAPRVNAAKAPGEWQSLDIVFRAPRFDAAGVKTENARFISVHVNGVPVQDNVEVTGPTRGHQLEGEAAKAPIVIQGNHGPIAIRKYTVTPLDLDDVASSEGAWIDLFNGKDLSGWNAILGEKGGTDSSLPIEDVFRVTDGCIHVYAGGLANSEQYFANLYHESVHESFHLQVEYRWLDKKFSSRTEDYRDAGILFHIHTEPTKVWPPAIEMQLGDGKPGDKYVTGDLFVLGNSNAEWPGQDDAYQAGAANIHKGWKANPRGRKGATSVYAENPHSEWNLAEVIVHSDQSAKFYLNGTLVNEVYNMEFNQGGKWHPLKSGHISVQAEWAELQYRTIRIKAI